VHRPILLTLATTVGALALALIPLAAWAALALADNLTR
jgi:hypothetical protein